MVGRSEYAKLSGLSVPELYAALGAGLAGGHAGEPDKDEQEILGRRYFETERSRIRSLVCGAAEVTVLREGGNVAEIAGTVGDLLLAHFGLPTVAILSMLIAKIGLRRLCADD